MKETIQFLFLLFFCMFISCFSKKANLGIAEQYFPNSKWLAEGIVNKYYTHSKKKDSYDTSSDIEYRSYQLGQANELLYNYYNPAFDILVAKTFSFQNNQMLLSEEKRFVRRDTLITTILKPISKDWENQKAQNEKAAIYDWGKRTWSSEQYQFRDTMIMSKPAKIFEIKSTFTQVYEEQPSKREMNIKEIYVQDLGLFSMEIINEESRTFMELVEQVPMKDFQKMVNHGRKRVAYINPNEIMDKGTDFKPCGVNNYIFDYYNGQGAYFYKGGKKEIWKVAQESLKAMQIGNESGYLTFRFIVNCKGEAGYFITEQADLNFQKKQFKQVTVEHFFQITQQLKRWNATQIREEEVDAYFYLTYKLKDGELIEILP